MISEQKSSKLQRWYISKSSIKEWIHGINWIKICTNLLSFSLQKEYSNDHEIVLHNVSVLATEGIYKCQVSGEGPLFATEVQDKKLRVAGT